MQKKLYDFRSTKEKNTFIEDSVKAFSQLHPQRKMNPEVLYGLIDSELSGLLPMRILTELTWGTKQSLLKKAVCQGTYAGYGKIFDILALPENDDFYYKEWKTAYYSLPSISDDLFDKFSQTGLDKLMEG